MPIKLIDLLPLTELIQLPANDVVATNLETHLKYALYGVEDRNKDGYDITVAKNVNGGYEIDINGKIKLIATPLHDTKNSITGWKFKYNTWSETMEHSPIHGYQGGFRDLFNFIKTEVDGKSNDTTNIDFGNNVQISISDLTKYINNIKKIIDEHDWYYELTDSHSTYIQGSKQITDIKENYKKLPKSGRIEILKYWNSKSPSMFKYDNFESFNKKFGS